MARFDDLAYDAALDAAERWALFDPDPTTRGRIDALIDAGEASAADIVELFTGRIAFGTAGLRAQVGPGPTRMNALVVRQTTAAVAAWLRSGDQPSTPSRRVIVGFDARHDSADFARHAAAALLAGGVEPLLANAWAPTPIFAHALLAERADAAIVITASHNPAADNGYKLYAGDGLQIVPPAEADIAALITDRANRWSEFGPSIDDAFADADRLDAQVVDIEHWMERHRSDVLALVPGVAAPLKVVYTPMHGVGAKPMLAAMQAAGFAAPLVVHEQAAPDPTFPTVDFPNPEEPGALDLAIAQAVESGADCVLAHDPDADRLAVALPSRSSDRWRRLSGDELGVLLGDFVLRNHGSPGAVVARSVVSGRLLDAVAESSGASCHVTLTGFKWIARTGIDHGPWLFGYEEAIGFAVGDRVRDKDGIGAGLVALAMLAEFASRGRTAWDRLDELHVNHGVHLTAPVTIRYDDEPGALADVVASLDGLTPEALAGSPIAASGPIGLGSLPPTSGVEWRSIDGSRVIVRPSGTEPKIKAYLEVVEERVPARALEASRIAAKERLDRLASEVASLLADEPEQTSVSLFAREWRE